MMLVTALVLEIFFDSQTLTLEHVEEVGIAPKLS